MIRNHRRLAAAFACIVSLVALRSTFAAEPAVLQEIPDDASAVVVASNLKTLSTRLANLGTRLNLPGMPPDPVGYAMRMLGVVKGFDPNSSAALVILKPPAVKEGDETEPRPQFVLLLPTTDSKAMLERWTPSEPDQAGISEVTLPTSGVNTGYVVNSGKFLAFAQEKETLTAFLAKKQPLNKVISADLLKSFEKNDLVFYANINTFSKKAADALEAAAQDQIGTLALTDLQSANETSSALRRTVVEQVFSLLKETALDANTALVTLRLTDAGITFGLVSDFKEESPIGKFLLAQKSAHAPQMTGLPAGNFLAAGALAWDAQSIADIVKLSAAKSLADPVVAKDERIEQFKKASAAYAELIGLTNSANFAYFENSADSKNGWMNGAMVLDVKDPAKYLALTKELLNSPLATETMEPDLTATVAVTPDAITVKGAKFMKVVKKISLREATDEHPLAPNSKRTYEQITRQMGPNGSVIYLGAVGQKIVAIIGTDPTTIESTVDAVQKKSDALATNPQIAAAANQLVTNPLLVTYVSVERFLPIIHSTMMTALGVPSEKAEAAAPATQPAVQPAPAYLSVGVSRATLTGEFHLPTSAINSCIQYGLSLKALITGAQPPATEPPAESQPKP